MFSFLPRLGFQWALQTVSVTQNIDFSSNPIFIFFRLFLHLTLSYPLLHNEIVEIFSISNHNLVLLLWEGRNFLINRTDGFTILPSSAGERSRRKDNLSKLSGYIVL